MEFISFRRPKVGLISHGQLHIIKTQAINMTYGVLNVFGLLAVSAQNF